MPIRKFIKHESASGILLIVAVILAMVLDNSPLSWLYDGLLSTPLAIQVGNLLIHKPLLLWINDGLMAVFFFLIGLEIKREFIEGELSSIKQATLPIVAAFGGLFLPALIYMYFNHGDPITSEGWGIPVATDIAFALGILSLLGDRIPRNLKILLLSLAIIDDICAIVIIALFYTENLSFLALSLASIGFCCALILNRANVARVAPYVLIGIFMWVCVLKSGVHATLAGVALAMVIPIKTKAKDHSPLKVLEHNLHPWVAYFIMPLFAFTNAGVSLHGFSLAILTEPISIGIIAGLFLGKQLGIMLFSGFAVLSGLCKLPTGISWVQVYGLALLCGIGFTMSLFIGTLAFEDPALIGQVRISVLIASLLSTLCGYCVLRFTKVNKESASATY